MAINRMAIVMKPEIKVVDKLEEKREIDGTFTYIEGTHINSKIVINKNSNKPSQVLIHECIHNALSRMEMIPELEKLSHRINRREDFVYALSVSLSEIFKFYIKPINT